MDTKAVQSLHVGTCNNRTFVYVIGGRYKGGDVPEGMRLFSIPSGKWLKVHFTGGIKAFPISKHPTISVA